MAKLPYEKHDIVYEEAMQSTADDCNLLSGDPSCDPTPGTGS
jgi:hypothetical protein